MFSVSLTGVLLLRKLTKKLYIRVSTKEELDSAQSYLTFRDLESLHQHMREGAGEEEKYDLEKLSLESLKVKIISQITRYTYQMFTVLTLVLGHSLCCCKLKLYPSRMLATCWLCKTPSSYSD